MRVNTPQARQASNSATALKTHEGAPAKRINKEAQLRRSILANMLWEDEFYESGTSIATRIANLVKEVPAETVAALAVEARTQYKLRHVPLLLARMLAKQHTGALVGETITNVIQRADELAEFVAIYWKDKKEPLSKQTKIGLARAFVKFDEYSLAKYNREGKVSLKDVLFLCHAKPANKAQEKLWKRLINDELKTPDTWEVALSAGADKGETFARLIKEEKLGYLALLRNLRNMTEAGVDEKIVREALLKGAKNSKALPFRFLAAAKHAPNYENTLEEAMLLSLENHEKMPGRSVFLIDVSGSMNAPISGKSDLKRIDAACALAILGREICEDVAVYTFSNNLVRVPSRRGMALAEAIDKSQSHGGTDLGGALKALHEKEKYDRLVVFTDEQSHTAVGPPRKGSRGYMVNVASAKNGVGYGKWNHVDGFSEAIITYIQKLERDFSDVSED